MAVCNSTQTLETAGRQAFGVPANFPHLHEKISCSFGDVPFVDPFSLLGSFLTVDEFQPPIGRHPAETFTYRCQVAGVLVGSPVIGSLDQLLVRVDGDDRDQLIPVSNLTVKSIEPPYLGANPS